jgi:hypothetical protein
MALLKANTPEGDQIVWGSTEWVNAGRYAKPFNEAEVRALLAERPWPGAHWRLQVGPPDHQLARPDAKFLPAVRDLVGDRIDEFVFQFVPMASRALLWAWPLRPGIHLVLHGPAAARRAGLDAEMVAHMPRFAANARDLRMYAVPLATLRACLAAANPELLQFCEVWTGGALDAATAETLRPLAERPWPELHTLSLPLGPHPDTAPQQCDILRNVSANSSQDVRLSVDDLDAFTRDAALMAAVLAGPGITFLGSGDRCFCVQTPPPQRLAERPLRDVRRFTLQTDWSADDLAAEADWYAALDEQAALWPQAYNICVLFAADRFQLRTWDGDHAVAWNVRSFLVGRFALVHPKFRQRPG